MKPCPHCGGSELYPTVERMTWPKQSRVFVLCLDCGAGGPPVVADYEYPDTLRWRGLADRAEAAWNERKP